MQQRLQKALAAAGIASRRSCEELIKAGRVSVNGARVTALGTLADPEVDQITVDGRPLPKPESFVYLALNKPIGFVSTVKDPHAKHTVIDLVKEVPQRVYPVGRLDEDSAGLLLLTNDGDFAVRLTHPRHEVEKTYRAIVRGKPQPHVLDRLRSGVRLEDGMTLPASIEMVEYQPQHRATVLDITLKEGRNRQIRRMCLAVNLPVIALTRTRIGPIELKGIAPGRWRKLRSSEVAELIELSGGSTAPVSSKTPSEGDKPVRTQTRSSSSASNRSAAPRTEQPMQTRRRRSERLTHEDIQEEAAALAKLLDAFDRDHPREVAEYESDEQD